MSLAAANAPAFVDLNGDAHTDLMAGEEAGGRNYFRGVAGSAVAATRRVPAELKMLSSRFKIILSAPVARRAASRRNRARAGAAQNPPGRGW